VGRDSSVGIATQYGLDGPVIESLWRRISLTRPYWPRVLLWVPGHTRGVKRPGRGVDHPPASSVEAKEWVDVYIYYQLGVSRTVWGELYTPHLLPALPYSFFPLRSQTNVGRDSSVGMSTRYRLGGSGIESRWERDSPHPFRFTVGPPPPASYTMST
jgi:hypothetical protein